MADSTDPRYGYARNYKEKEENFKQHNNLAEEATSESHMIYELKAKREYFLRKLLDIQNAINAVERI